MARNRFIEFVDVPNLISNSDFILMAPNSSVPPTPDDWTFPTGHFEFAPGGIDHDGRFLRIEGDHRRDVALRGERIPLVPGRDYFQSGWARLAPNGTCQIGRNFLDEDGEVIHTAFVRPRTRMPGWILLQQRLSPNSGGSGDDRIPAGAKYVEPIVRFRNTVGIDALFLGLVPDAVTAAPEVAEKSLHGLGPQLRY